MFGDTMCLHHNFLALSLVKHGAWVIETIRTCRMYSCRPLLCLLIAATGLSVSSGAHAIDPDSRLPIEIESDKAVLDDAKGLSVYSGNVIISQGETKLEADVISVQAIERRIVSIEAAGTPAHFVQRPQPDSELTHGYAKEIEYLAKDAVLMFRGDARLVQNDNSFSGNEIEYDIVRKAIRAKGDEQVGSRVKIQYHPSPSPQAESEVLNSAGPAEQAPVEPQP